MQKEGGCMEQRELNDLFMQQINDRNKIIDKLLDERKAERRLNWIDFTKDLFMFIIIIFMIWSYFWSDWDSAVTSTTTNYNENINHNEGGEE